tara:strand:+ start:280 stop:441 length:162 start_codon:yes stop_codon:yes gene_type:complete
LPPEGILPTLVNLEVAQAKFVALAMIDSPASERAPLTMLVDLDGVPLTHVFTG